LGDATRNQYAFNAMPGSLTQRLFVATLALLLGGAGCSTVRQPQGAGPQTPAVQLSDCRQWFQALDDAVAEYGIADVAARRVAGFPYLRVDRFSASFGDEAGDDTPLREAWVARMRALDAEGRRVEIANLPDDGVRQLGAGAREELMSLADECARHMTTADLPGEAAMTLLRKRARVPDDYSAFKRTIGLYGLTGVPFSAGIDDWQGKTEQAFSAARQGQTASGAVVPYVPPADPVMTRAQVSELLVAAAAEPLGIPRLSAQQRERLFATYAPILEIETAGDYDRIGRLYWSSALALRVDVSAPTVYRNLAYTRVDSRTLVQLVYTVWMPERPRESRYDMLAGHLDGIVWRVTLAPDGEPVLFDSIHPCGCFHMFFPTPRAVAVPSPEPYIEWAFSPAPLPAVAEADRIVISAQTRTHYLTNVWPASAAEGVSYAFADYDELRTLPLPSGGSRSAFGPDGLIAGTERGERFFFWPMGIASPGAMRQWGSQPTAFVGRRHFDDADLIENRFRLLP
jgi:uncharacterized protein YceK